VPNGSGSPVPAPPAPVVMSIVGFIKNSLKEAPCKFLGKAPLRSAIASSATWVLVQSLRPVIPPL